MQQKCLNCLTYIRYVDKQLTFGHPFPYLNNYILPKLKIYMQSNLNVSMNACKKLQNLQPGVTNLTFLLTQVMIHRAWGPLRKSAAAHLLHNGAKYLFLNYDELYNVFESRI